MVTHFRCCLQGYDQNTVIKASPSMHCFETNKTKPKKKATITFYFQNSRGVMQSGADFILLVGGKAACCAFSSDTRVIFRLKSNLFLITKAASQCCIMMRQCWTVLNKSHCLIFDFVEAKKEGDFTKSDISNDERTNKS